MERWFAQGIVSGILRPLGEAIRIRAKNSVAVPATSAIIKVHWYLNWFI